MFAHSFTYNFPTKLARLLIEPLGDVHIGDPNCNYEKLQERVNAIKRDKNRYWLGMGDYISNIMPFRQGMVDKRWNWGTVDRRIMTQQEQYAETVRIFKPIANKCIGMLWGNHEWGNALSEDDFINPVCKQLGVKFLGAKCFVVIKCKHQGRTINNFVIWATHGRYSGGLIGGAMNKLRRYKKKYDADIYLMGHTHYKNIDPSLQTGIDVNTIKIGKKPKLLCLTGSFLEEDVQDVDNYGDRAPSEDEHKTGTITIELDPFNSKIHAHE